METISVKEYILHFIEPYTTYRDNLNLFLQKRGINNIKDLTQTELYDNLVLFEADNVYYNFYGPRPTIAGSMKKVSEILVALTSIRLVKSYFYNAKYFFGLKYMFLPKYISSYNIITENKKNKLFTSLREVNGILTGNSYSKVKYVFKTEKQLKKHITTIMNKSIQRKKAIFNKNIENLKKWYLDRCNSILY